MCTRVTVTESNRYRFGRRRFHAIKRVNWMRKKKRKKKDLHRSQATIPRDCPRFHRIADRGTFTVVLQRGFASKRRVENVELMFSARSFVSEKSASEARPCTRAPEPPSVPHRGGDSLCAKACKEKRLSYVFDLFLAEESLAYATYGGTLYTSVTIK